MQDDDFDPYKYPLYDANVAKYLIIPYHDEILMTEELLHFFSGPPGQTAKLDDNCIVVSSRRKINPNFWESKANDIIRNYTNEYTIHFKDTYTRSKNIYVFCIHDLMETG